MIRTRPLALLGSLLMLGIFACDEGTPVSPAGTILRISAQPSRITKTGSSQISMQALRSNGNPVNAGTEVRMSSTIGTIDPVVFTAVDGTATAALRGDGRVGTATVTAYSGANDPVTVDVAIGSPASSIRLQVTPSGVPEGGGTLDLLALVRDEEGQPLADATVNFTTEIGLLDSGGSFLVSDESGEARDELTVSAADLQTVGGNSFEVTVEVGATGGVQSDTFAVSIQRAPRASFTFQRVDNRVAFNDTSTGGPTFWEWDFGDGNRSSQQNPVHEYSAPGTYIVTLTVQNAVGSDTTNGLIVIP